jgi:hypothetical protein
LLGWVEPAGVAAAAHYFASVESKTTTDRICLIDGGLSFS